MKRPTPPSVSRAIEKVTILRPRRKYRFRLFVAGATERSRAALSRVRQLCEAELKGRYELEVIDVYQQPEKARVHQIIATPTLVKILPSPESRFIGNLSNFTGIFTQTNALEVPMAKP